MEVQELKQLIKSNKVPNFLIFTGEEYMVQRIYIQQIAKAKKLEVKYIDSIFDIWASLNSRSLFGKNYLYVLIDDKDFMTEEKIYTQIENRLHDNMLILQLTSVDKRLKILKTYKTTIFEFNPLKSEILKRYIQKEIHLSDRNCEILMEVAEYNYGRCLLEIDKIKRLAERIDNRAYSDNYNTAFKDLIEDGTIHVPPRDNIWNFIKAFLKNRPLEAYELWQELKELKTPTMSILSNLYTEAKHVLQVQICTSNDVAKTTGLNSWQIRNAKECVGYFGARDLAYLMRLIQKVESGIKQGRIEESIAIDYIFTELF